MRRLLTEAAQCYGRGKIGYKSKALKARQYGNSAEVIAYADKANERFFNMPSGKGDRLTKFFKLRLDKGHYITVTIGDKRCEKFPQIVLSL